MTREEVLKTLSSEIAEVLEYYAEKWPLRTETTEWDNVFSFIRDVIDWSDVPTGFNFWSNISMEMEFPDNFFEVTRPHMEPNVKVEKEVRELSPNPNTNIKVFYRAIPRGTSEEEWDLLTDEQRDERVKWQPGRLNANKISDYRSIGFNQTIVTMDVGNVFTVKFNITEFDRKIEEAGGVLI